MAERPIASQELEVVRWLLANAATRDASMFREESLQSARVVGGCSCGCASIDFLPDGVAAGSFIVADAVAVWPDGARAGVILWGRQEGIAAVEIHDMDPGSSRRFPTADFLRTAEGFYKEIPPTR